MIRAFSKTGSVIFLAGAVYLAGCTYLNSLKPSDEKVRQEQNKTVYRSKEEPPNERVNIAPSQKVPGE